jgi:coenzyme F420-reducing hydrogenase delta subunit
MAHMGVEAERIHFSWVSSAESTKFVRVVKEVTEAVRELGPNRRFVKSHGQDRQSNDEKAA